jgi:ADP-heptose:LPS heptosyltransferase
VAVSRPTLLVLRALGLGDLLTGVPALRALRRARPGHRLVLAGPPGLAPLVRLTGAVDELLPAQGVAAPPRLSWTGPPPELAVNLHGRGPGSTRSLAALAPGHLWSFAPPPAGRPAPPSATPDGSGPSSDGPEAGPPGAETGPSGGGAGPVWRAGEHEVERWCRLVTHYGAPADPADLLLAEPEVESPAPGAVVVHPGAASGARRWPVERFAAVARALEGDGHRVVVTAGPAERDLARAVAEPMETDLATLAALVAGAALVLCGDTGIAHLATAYGTPSVVLFGPTPPAEWGPRQGPHTALWAGRRGDPHAARPDPGLLELTVPDVLSAARRRTRAPVAPQ